MDFAQAERIYRELEEMLVRGELGEEDFAVQIAQLRVVDRDGRQWMLSGRTGRWLVYDGLYWVFAQPPREKVRAKAAVGSVVKAAPTSRAEVAAAAAPTLRGHAPRGAQPGLPRPLVLGLAALLLIGCLIGAGASAWVLFFRDLGEARPTVEGPSAVAMVETYTPRPATATYTPTFTPTPSRTPTPTITPIPTETPIPTDTPIPTASFTPLPPAPTAAPTSTSSPSPSPTPTTLPTVTPAPPSGQTYTVRQGDTLSEIAARFGVSVQALVQANGIENPALIRPGQVLVIPVPGTTPTTPTVAATPTWTPIVLITPETTAQATPAPTTTAGTPMPTPTRIAPTPTRKPTAAPKPTATKSAALSGKIAFTVWNPYIGTGVYELYVSLIDGTGRNMLGTGFRQPQFRQDGNMLAANGDGAPGYDHLVMMNPGGGELREISEHSEDSFPTWSADARFVAFSSSSWGDGYTRLGVAYDIYGKQWNWITFEHGQIQGDYPFWMPDGRLVYHGCNFWIDNIACGLYWVWAAGGTPQQLTTHPNDTAPAGSGSRVAFMSSRDGNWEVYTVNVDGSGLKRLTNNAAEDGLPAWSPDGRSIAFVSRRSGAWAIWAMNADGSNQRKLFDLGGGYGSGAFDWTSERISWAP